MAMKKISSEEGKAFKYLNPDGDEDICPPKTEYPEPEELMKSKLKPSPEPDQQVLHNKLAEPWFKPKTGSVIPAKRRLVKTMMFDQIVKCFCSVSDTKKISSSAGGSETHKAEASDAKKIISSRVYPSPP